MNVLHAISGIDAVAGGPAVAVSNLAVAQQRCGIGVATAFTWVDAPALEQARALANRGLNVHSLGPCRDPMSRHRDLPEWIDGLVAQADIVHIHAMWESIQHYAARAAQRRGIPYVITPHGMIDRWNMSNGWLKKRLYLAWRAKHNLKRAAAVHFATEQERRWAVLPPLQCRRIIEPFGINFDEFDNLPPAGSFARTFPAAAGRPFAIFLGRIDRGKGWEYLIPAFAKATESQDLREWLLVIAGPDYFGNLGKARDLARRSGILDRTVFTGMLSAPQRLAALRDCEFLALPSCHENFGIVVAEAMAAGTPAIVSDQVALHHEVREWQAGAVTRLNAREISSTLEQWMRDPAMRDDAGRRGYEMARKHFDWSTIASHWVEHYKAIAALRG